MTLETLSRPPVVNISPTKTPFTRKVLGIFEESGGIATKEYLIEVLRPQRQNQDDDVSYVRQGVSKARKDLEATGKTIKFIAGENPYYAIVDDDRAITLPNGNTVKIIGDKQRDVLRLLISQAGGEITANDAYPDGKNYERSEGNLSRIIKVLRKKIPKDYVITSKTDEEEVTHYRFIEDTSKATLPNGKIIKGITQHEHAVLSYFIDENLPVYMQTLTDRFYPGVDYEVARSRIRVRIQDLKKALAPSGAELKLVTKYHTPNSAYQLVAEGPTKTGVHPFTKAGDEYIQGQIDKITALLEAQMSSKSLALADETTSQLATKLQQLKEEVEMRKHIEEEKRRRIEEWKRKQARLSERNALPEPKTETECPAQVKLTRLKYRYDGKGLTNEILDNAGYLALEEARKRFDPKSGVSFENYAEFWIRGTMGNMILHNSPEAPQTNKKLPIQGPEAIDQFRGILAIALIDLSNSKRYPTNAITPDESRALDIMLGVTGKNPGSIDDVTYEFDCSIQWAERLMRCAITKVKDSSHAPALARYLSE